MYGSIGTIIKGTHRNQDLIPAFKAALKDISPRARVGRPIPAAARENDDHPWWQSDDAAELLEEITLLLEERALPYCYFGTHPGNLSDYGFWPDINGLEEAARHSDGVLKLNAGDEWPELDPDIQYVMAVTDHGNVSLYNRSGKELWAVV